MNAPRRVLVVGAGWIGRQHLQALALTGRVRAGVCEPNGAARQAVDPALTPAGSFELLASALTAAWDAAIVATPAHTHLAVGRQLTVAGIPVLVEKPLALELAGLDEWAAGAGPPVMVGYVFRCHPVLEKVRREIAAGRIGTPLQVTARRGAHLPARRPEYASTYYARPEQGGGVVHDILSHVYNATEWLVGPIDRVAADGAHLRLPQVTVDDTVHAWARHGAVLASYAVNQHQHVAEFVIEVHGAEGSVRANFTNGSWAAAPKPDADWVTEALPSPKGAEWLARQANIFLDVIEGRANAPCPLADGMATLRAILATLRSLQAEARWTAV